MITPSEIVNKYPYLKLNPGWHDLPDGWVELLEDLCDKLNEQAKKENVVLSIIQIKSKYGSLRCYLEFAPNDSYYEIINDYENKSERTCEICGSSERVGQTGGWIVTLCKEHGEKEFGWEEYAN